MMSETYGAPSLTSNAVDFGEVDVFVTDVDPLFGKGGCVAE